MGAVPLRFARVLVKVSGEMLSRAGRDILDAEGAGTLADEIAAAHALGAALAVVNGAGNVLRGGEARVPGLSRPTADAMGMLATVQNALALEDLLEARGVPARVLSAVPAGSFAEPYARRAALRHLAKGRVVLLAGGTGQPYFTTDTTAALRALEVGAEALLKGTKVDGVYDRDPKVHPDAVRFARIRTEDAWQRRLRVMDRTALTLCLENALPVVVFDMGRPGNLSRVLQGEGVGTLVAPDVETTHGRG